MKSKRGFACMTPEKRKLIASKGGSSIPPEKRYYSVNREAAREAGRKGGETSHGGGRKHGA